MSNIKDVARLAGLSPSTVSKYFRDQNSVREDSRKRISKAVSTLGYVPSSIARSLRGGRSLTIKAIMPPISLSFFAAVFEYLHEYCRMAGYNLVLQPIPLNSNFVPSDFEYVDGAVVSFPDNEKVVDRLVEMLGKFKKPLVAMLGHDRKHDCGIIRVDICSGMADAARYLKSSGRKHIAYVGGTKDSAQSRERFRGFEAVIEPDIRCGVYRSEFSLEWGYAAASMMLGSEVLPDAILCENDGIAAGVIKHFISNGIDVPGEVWVIGFDNTVLSEMYMPSISSVAIPSRAMSEAAVEILLRRINGEPDMNISFNTELILRDSSKHPTDMP